jgi:hypothetical protein
MAEDAPTAAPIVARFSLTEAEERNYARVLADRQYRAAGQDIAWYSYLGAIPVGFLGGFAAIGFGVGDFGAMMAVLVGLGYILGYYASYLASRLYQARLSAVYRRDVPGHWEGMTVTVGEAGVDSQWRKSRTFLSWGDITALTRERGLLIFWIGPSRGTLVPRRVLAEGDEAGIMRLASQHIGLR